MDEIVKQAIAKWPNVPHCYGWLALDARGNWRMRDERAQALNLPGDRITNAALLGFINRNYMHDEPGQWYFQNGPQRVYVNLEATPYVARTDPAHGFVLHTGEPMQDIEGAWMTETGRMLLKGAKKIAIVDDRDMAQCIAMLCMRGRLAEDQQLLDWLEDGQDSDTLTFRHGGKQFPMQRITLDAMEEYFGFVREPRPV